MVSRQNINGRPRPSGVLQTVQDGPAAGLADPTPTTIEGGTVAGAGAPPTGSARGRGTGRRGRGGRRRNGVIPDLNGEEEPPPTQPPPTGEGGLPEEYPPGKGPQPQVPPTQPHIIPGGSRSGGGAGYRARTGKIARETTEAQEAAGRGGRFGEQHVGRYQRTHPLSSGQHPSGIARYPSGPAVPRWARGVGGEGYGTDPGPLPPPPEPEPEIPPPTGLTDEEREARRRERQERRRRRGPRGRGRHR